MNTRSLKLWLASVLFLVCAFFAGKEVSRRTSVDTYHHVEAVGSGFQRLKHFIASAMYLQLDNYHHIEMYQGIPWDQVTDYLPQMWLIAKLDSHFTEVYNDASYHLAVNLGEVDQGLEFIREGVRFNPDSLDIVYQYAYLLWQTGEGENEEILDAAYHYRLLLRRYGGDEKQPYNEPSSAFLISEIIAEEDSLAPFVSLYRRRSSFIRSGIRAGIYYPGYLEEPPAFLAPPKGEI
ncbi:hypothetical protein CSA37_08945 [Candidatus Fermentibacteria bacterium]|nr:MAG: hypothetical protein CSA37_08945 [Candidatus Fermentibacteria bacterium]